ncbi:23S rRNA (uracil(1939)-C(5))-methyltransferase RlmD [Candidatus Woesearchaeota archaeon]|jgi:23S rRNA (uracil1939-C5)-methyltransferase|nr:23S rRNA (uracil(1939)-C(5))-methyltransferase RlmD [Candidatus Woesearchaeota archaeon]
MVEPICPHFGTCGGCNTQHVDYDTQLENKKRYIENLIDCENVKAFPSSPWHYRNRMDLLFSPTGLGFRVKGKWYKTVNIDKCFIADKKINKIADEIKLFFKDPDFFDIKKHNGTLRYAVIRTPQNTSSISFVLNSDSFKISNAIDKIKEFAKTTSAENIIVTYVHSNTDTSISEDFFVIKGKDMLTESYLGKQFTYHVQGFFQNNTEMAEQMHKYVNNILKTYETKNKTLLDLYAGVGTFGIINSELFKTVIIAESFPQCIDAAKINLETNKITNATAHVLDAKYLKKLELPTSDLFFITDPPRCGMNPKTIDHINTLKPEVIIYVSCNPNQLGRDIHKLRNYQIKSAAVFDLFPQTPHCEAVVELILKTKTPEPTQ